MINRCLGKLSAHRLIDTSHHYVQVPIDAREKAIMDFILVITSLEFN